MKVMCINGYFIQHPSCEGHPHPELGDIDVVTGDHSGSSNHYLLERFGGEGFRKSHFAPLSDIDETETEVYKNLQTQTV